MSPRGIPVSWEATTEIDLVGFNLHSPEGRIGPWTQLDSEIIPSQAPGSPFGADYAWEDASVRPGVTYCYNLQSVNVGEADTWEGPVCGAAPITLQWRPFQRVRVW